MQTYTPSIEELEKSSEAQRQAGTLEAKPEMSVHDAWNITLQGSNERKAEQITVKEELIVKTVPIGREGQTFIGFQESKKEIKSEPGVLGLGAQIIMEHVSAATIAKKTTKEAAFTFDAIVGIFKEYIFFKPKKEEKPEEKAKKAQAFANKRDFFNSLRAGVSALSNPDARRAMADKIAGINARRGTGNLSYEGVLDSSGQIVKSVEIELEQISAEEARRAQLSKIVNLGTAKVSRSGGPKVEATNLEMVGGNSRIKGASAVG